MLQKLRDKSSGWFATIILGLLTVPFAFFGMEQYLFQNNATYAAKIEAPPKWWASAPSWWPATMLWQRDTISPEDFRTEFEQARQRQRQQQGDAFDARAFEAMGNKRQVLDAMIDRRVLGMAARRAGMVVDDSQVRAAIQAVPGFQVNGKFNAQVYQQALASLSPPRTPLQFQQEVRDDLERTMIPTQLVQSAFVTPSQVDAVMKLLDEKRDVAYVTLPAPAPDQSPVGNDDIKRWYDAHKAQYRAPESVTLEYVEVDAGKLPPPAPPSDEALRKRYDAQKDKLGTPEQRLVSHILVKLDPGADAAAQKAALQKAEKIAAQARAPGADFAALARANSDDAGSKAGGGDLGWIAHNGAMVKPFEDAVFAMKAGEISAPVKSQFGYHVIDVREIRASQQPAFETVRDRLAQEQAKEDQDRAFNDLLGKMVDEAAKNPTTLAGAARLANLPVLKLGPIPRVAAGAKQADASDLATNAALQRQAFSDSMIADNAVGDPIAISPGRSVMIRDIAHAPERALTLAEATPRITAQIRADRAKKAVAARADAMLAKVKAGESLQALAGEAKLAMANVPAMPRNVPMLPPDAVEQVFAVPTPATGKLSAGKAALPDGSIVVFAVSKVIDGNPANATPAQRTQLQQQLAQIAGGLDADMLVHTLRKQATIQVSEDRL